MEALRIALGEQQITAIGGSYGTRLGAVYATLFPERVRAMVLDGYDDANTPFGEYLVRQDAAFERELDELLGECATDAACALNDDGNPGATLDHLLADLDRQPLPPPEPGDLPVGDSIGVTVIRMSLYTDEDRVDLLDALGDEAGTAGTRDLARLVHEVNRSGAKAVLVGDSRQLPEIAAGGLFAAQPAIELRDNRRQQHEWEIDALRELRDGDSTRALHAYLEHDRNNVGYDAYNTRTLLVGDWWAATVRGDDAVMLAGRRADVSELNAHGHLRARDAGWLTGPPIEVRGVSIQTGDRVMMLRNDRQLGVRNGNRGVVVDVDLDDRTMRVQLANRVVELPTAYLDAGHISHAYAMTVNKAHGLTCDATMMLGDDLMYRELAYEAMSRGRTDNRIYISRTTMTELDLRFEDRPHAPTVPPPDAMDSLAQGLERRRDKHLALDSLAASPLTTWSTRDLLMERDRVHTILDQAPPDRSGDLSALIKSRRDIGEHISSESARVTALESRKRPRKERKLPDVDLLTARHNLHHFEQRAERLDSEITTLHAGQHRRASHLAAHSVDRVELHAIVQVLDERLQEHINRSVVEPPSYITKTLGQRPQIRDGSRAWVSAVVAIEEYRLKHQVSDRRTAIGPEPRNFHQRANWYQANQAIEDARAIIAPPRQKRVQARPIESRSFGIEL